MKYIAMLKMVVFLLVSLVGIVLLSCSGESVNGLSVQSDDPVVIAVYQPDGRLEGAWQVFEPFYLKPNDPGPLFSAIIRVDGTQQRGVSYEGATEAAFKARLENLPPGYYYRIVPASEFNWEFGLIAYGPPIDPTIITAGQTWLSKGCSGTIEVVSTTTYVSSVKYSFAQGSVVLGPVNIPTHELAQTLAGCVKQ